MADVQTPSAPHPAFVHVKTRALVRGQTVTRATLTPVAATKVDADVAAAMEVWVCALINVHTACGVKRHAVRTTGAVVADNAVSLFLSCQVRAGLFRQAGIVLTGVQLPLTAVSSVGWLTLAHCILKETV